MIDTHLNNLDSALAHAKHAQSLLNDEPILINTEGNIWLRLGNTEKAIDCYEKALSINKNYAPAYNNLGNCYLKKERIDDAEQAYLQAIRHNPNFTDAHFNYGRLLLAKGNTTSALHILQHAYQLNSKHPAVLGQLGEIHLLQDNNSEAISFFLQRLKYQPLHPSTHHRLGLARLKREEFELAIKSFKKALELGATDTDCHYQLATCYIEMGHLKEALMHYFQQLEVEADSETYYNIGVILMAQEHHHDSLTYFNETVRLNPSSIDAWLNMGAIALKLGRISQAIDYYTECIKMDPDNQEYQHVLAALNQRSGTDSTPPIYIKNLFDHYAPFYDTHLSEHLHYDVPDTIARYLEDFLNDKQEKTLKIIDLGCGTGLMGEAILSWKRQLIGIDLSPSMIKAASDKGCYDELVIGDIAESILPYKKADLIIAADVFSYVGDLSLIAERSKNALIDGGLFVFTVEKGIKDPYQLQQTIRYTHHRRYIESLAKTYGFSLEALDNVPIRKQKGKPVEGYLVVMKKPLA